jgi:carboxylate-amine ligase
MLIKENIWRAQRYGVEDSLIDFGKGSLVSFADLTDELIDLVRKDAEMLGCVSHVERAAQIVREGTSADRQLEAFRSATADGADDAEALVAVVDQLIAETVVGV